jgi:hypothetical protein
MSFRRGKDKPLSWNRWIIRHRDELNAAGIPEAVFSDENRWGRFLGEGGLDLETGWRVGMLSPKQADILQRLITEQFPREELASCCRALAEVIRKKRK